MAPTRGNILLSTYFPRTVEREGVGSLAQGLARLFASEGWQVRMLLPQGQYPPQEGVEILQYNQGLGSYRRYCRAVAEHSDADAVLMIENNPVLAGAASASRCGDNTFSFFATPCQDFGLLSEMGLSWQSLKHALGKHPRLARRHDWPQRRCIVGTAYQALQLQSLGAAEVHVMPVCGVSSGRAVPSREQARRKLGWDERPVAGYLGHFSPAKGVDVLVEAFAQCDGPAMLALDPSGRGQLPARAHRLRLNLERQSRLHLTSAGDPLLFLAACDVTVLPYRTSSNFHLPQVMLESFAAGTAVISTDIGGLGEGLRDGRCGYLVPPRDAASLTRTMKDVLSDLPGLHEKGLAARETFVRRYCLEEFARGFVNLLR